jgi:type I restriction enzyme S subunit
VVSDLRAFIEHKCPNGVKFQRLGDIATLVRGNGLSKKQLVGSDVGAIHYGQIYTKYSRFTTTTISRVDQDIADKLVVVNPGDVIVACTSENMEDVCTPLAWLGEEPIVTGGHTVTIRHRLDPKYLVYWLGSQAFQRQKRAIAGGVKVIDVSAKKLATVMVPVSPLEVQREIVKVLDRFTQLEAELEARRKQYLFYLEKLVRNSQDANIFKLGHYEELGLIELGRGKVISRRELAATPGDYPVYSSSAVNNGEFGRYGSYMFDDSRITWSIDGGGKLFFREPHCYSVTNVCGWLVSHSDQVVLKYIYYVLVDQWNRMKFDYTKRPIHR